MEQLLSDNLSDFSAVNKKDLNKLVGLVEELVINKVKIEKMKNEFSDNSQAKILDQELRIISEIQESIKKVRLIKLKTISTSLQDLVSQNSRDYNIPVNLSFDGQETEIENSLINYIHNLFAYFIKDIFENEFAASKDTVHYISISANSDGKNLVAVIESNGTGFNSELVQKPLDKERIELVSFSEEEFIKFLNLTNRSADIEILSKLRQELLYLDGQMLLESQSNAFRRITLVIPMSSSIMQGLLVTIENQVYAIPLEFVETILDRNTVTIKKSAHTQMIIYMNHVTRLINVAEILGKQVNNDSSCILIVNANGIKAALLVDSLLDQTDMVIKKCPSIINGINEIKGTTILGDGLVTLVLDIPAILKEI